MRCEKYVPDLAFVPLHLKEITFNYEMGALHPTLIFVCFASYSDVEREKRAAHYSLNSSFLGGGRKTRAIEKEPKMDTGP